MCVNALRCVSAVWLHTDAMVAPGGSRDFEDETKFERWMKPSVIDGKIQVRRCLLPCWVMAVAVSSVSMVDRSRR
jgi:hypothetical protein